MSEEQYIKTAVSLIGISAIAAASRTILTEERRSIKGFCRAVFLATFVGAIVGGIIHGYSLSPPLEGAIVGVCAFVADDLLLAVLALAGWFRKNPAAILNVVLGRKIDP